MSASSYEEELQEREVRQKQYDAIVAKSVSEVEASLLSSRQGFHHSTFFGAMGIDPKHLAIWYFFTKDSDLREAEESNFTKEIVESTHESLKRNGYPSFIVPSIHPSFATDEEVQRDYSGNYWHYLK